jgi:hypothetical protein
MPLAIINNPIPPFLRKSHIKLGKFDVLMMPHVSCQTLPLRETLPTDDAFINNYVR